MRHFGHAGDGDAHHSSRQAWQKWCAHDAIAADEMTSMQMAHEAQEGGSSAIGTSDASADVREVGIADRASCRLAV